MSKKKPQQILQVHHAFLVHFFAVSTRQRHEISLCNGSCLEDVNTSKHTTTNLGAVSKNTTPGRVGIKAKKFKKREFIVNSDAFAALSVVVPGLQQSCVIEDKKVSGLVG